MTHVLGRVKWTVAAAAIAVFAIAGTPTKALALGFGFGDLGYYVYGGNNERYESFGVGSSAPTLASGANRNISSDLSTLNVGASTGLRYSVIGTSQDGLSLFFSTPNSTISAAQNGNTFAGQAADQFLLWGGQHGAATGGVGNPLANNPSITAASAAHSFTTILTNTGSIAGQMGVSTHGTLDQMLNIFRVNIDGNEQVFTKVGTALLTASGEFSVAPIPVPAAVILFGTGLAGLVGVARRSFNRMA